MAEYIKNIPEGHDLTKGMAQTKLCHAIEQYMLETDEKKAINPRIIGLRGKWGTGKSNVIQLLKNSEGLKDKYHFIEYDTWGHQEDQPRQSLMQFITKELTEHKLLPDKVNIGSVDISWNDYLTHILSRKNQQESTYQPQLPDSIRWLIIAFLASTVLNLIISYFDDNPQTHFARLLFTSLPWVVYGFYFLCYHNSFDDLLLLFDKNYRSGKTITSLYIYEPSATDFREWLHTVESNSQKKIVIVLDNMDRLPQHNVKQLWSTIHTFFAYDDFPDIWVIIPFDSQHMYEALGKDVAESFINKTIPITFRVPTPIIADFRSLFDQFYSKAFGTNDPTQDIVRHLYDKTQNKTIRHLIAFINRAVTYKKQFPDINTAIIAIVLIEEKELLEKETPLLLSDKFHKKYQLYMPIYEQAILDIARLIYGLDSENAAQVLIEDVLNRTLEGVEDEILKNAIANRYFFDVADHYFSDFDLQTFDADIHLLCDIERLAPEEQHVKLNSIWSFAIAYYQNESDFWSSPLHEKYFIALLKHAEAKQKQPLLQQYFYSLRDSKGNELYGIAEQIASVLPNKNILTQMPLIRINVDSYIQYLNKSKEFFQKYPFTCDLDALTRLLISKGIDQVDNPDFFISLKEHGGTFYEKLHEHFGERLP